jgi:hypothetical protein
VADRMVRCSEGHFYDSNKHSACPWCAPPLDITPAGSDATGTTRVMPLMDVTPATIAIPAPPAGPAPVASIPPPPTDAETRRYGQLVKGVDPVVGWLVCLEGPDRGRDFRLKMERNFIGRSSNMDICLVNDERVSRERHASLVFDPQNRSFLLVPGDSAGLIYLNGTLLHAPAQLKADDVIDVGSSKLVMVPFCGEKFAWA